MHQRVLELQRQSKDNLKTIVKTNKDKNKDKIHELIERLQRSLTELESKVRDLEKKVIAGMTESPKEEKEGKESKLSEKIYGFSIIQKKTSTTGRVYYKWYAHRRIEDKQHWIYLGEDTSRAEAKIKAWLEANYPRLLEEDN